jgi:hypothetical protein
MKKKLHRNIVIFYRRPILFENYAYISAFIWSQLYEKNWHKTYSESLLCEHKALSSHPSSTTKKKKEKKLGENCRKTDRAESAAQW